MPERVEITDVQLSSPRSVPPTAISGGETSQIVDGSVTVVNQSDKTTFHIISDLRSLSYDPSTQTLVLGFVDPPPNATRQPIPFFPPTQTALPPGETAVLNAPVPLIIRQLRASEGRGMTFDEIDVSEVQQVQCVLAYDPNPFRPAGPRAGVEMRAQLASWGKRAEATFQRTLPSHDTPP